MEKRKDWFLVDIYADEAITGTQVTKRENFQRMINDCMDGKIDMIITKSISRFARNTLDTLKYVRMLKERNIAVFFEDENINTMTMDGELQKRNIKSPHGKDTWSKHSIQTVLTNEKYIGNVLLGKTYSGDFPK